MTNTFPEYITVGVVTYRVTQDRNEWLKVEHDTNTRDYYGHSVHREAVIYLHPDADEAVTRLTLWHEVLHAVHESSMGSPEFRHLGKDTLARQETIVRMHEMPTLAVLRANPRLVSYLTAA